MGKTRNRCCLCDASDVPFFANVSGCSYHRCNACGAVLLDTEHLPTPEEEKAQYRLHQNDADDAGYRCFLSRLADPLLERLSPGSYGLDYGCGPGPTLSRMLTEAGHTVRLYDPFFAANEMALREEYDFITCSEVVEHFHRPKEEFERLHAMLKPGGWLGLTTCFQTDDSRFADWHYRRDPTHVVFYREETFRYLARTCGWLCEIPKLNVVLMRKNK